MNKVCKNCDHLIYPDEVHECPTKEYLEERDKLISEAAQYDEDNFWNEDGVHEER